MVRRPVLFDTCILIDYLRGIPQARAVCDRNADRAISIVTWMEVMAGVTAGNEDETRGFLLNFQPLPLTPEIAERAVAIRRASKIKLPQCNHSGDGGSREAGSDHSQYARLYNGHGGDRHTLQALSTTMPRPATVIFGYPGKIQLPVKRPSNPNL